MKYILLTLFIIMISLECNAQNASMIDGDRISLRDSLSGEVILLNYIERGSQNKDAIWITYDRRPGVDPWITEAENKKIRLSEDGFIRYWQEREIKILGAITTFDDCGCFKTRSMSSPDMFLIHFKVFPDDWKKITEFYPEIEYYTRKVKYQ